MQINIIVHGKLKKTAPEALLIESYIKKTQWPIKIIELEEKKTLSTAELKKAESALILNALPSATKLIVLDEKGKTPTSAEFAKLLQKFEDTGAPSITFAIGGANGHDETLKQKADYLLSFGHMTLPHMLARVVLTEQIYRAKSILSNHPYHRE